MCPLYFNPDFTCQQIVHEAFFLELEFIAVLLFGVDAAHQYRPQYGFSPPLTAQQRGFPHKSFHQVIVPCDLLPSLIPFFRQTVTVAPDILFIPVPQKRRFQNKDFLLQWGN